MTIDTLQAALDRAVDFPETGLRLLDRREQPTWYPWAEVKRRALRVAGGLQALGIEPGERVAIIFPTSIEFFDAFFGAILAGAVPTPLYPPVRLGRMSAYHQRTARMIELSGARLVLTDKRVNRVLGQTIELARPSLGCKVIGTLPEGPCTPAPYDPDALAMVQFSSGTTVDPKPVALSHRAVMAQTDLLLTLITAQDEVPDAGVSWLPLYHDMGLIGCVFPALRHPGPLTLLGPEVFVTRPAAWLRALSTYGGTVSPAPNFAYALCTDRIKDEELEGVDLSNWHYALNGAEPVAPEVLRAFQARFARWGLRPEALNPVYGMSEAALAVSFSETTAPFTSTVFDREALAGGRAVAVDDGVEIPSVGVAVPGFTLEVRDADQRPVASGTVGRVWAKGPSLMDGYLDQPEATARALVDGWLDTGDLGFMHDGQLYLTGRAKDVLILRGRNHAPHPVEQAVDGLPGARTGCAAAVSHRPEGQPHEHLHLFVEVTKAATAAERAALPEAAKAAVLAATGLACDAVHVLDAGTLPRTSSGKIRRQETLRLHQGGALTAPDRITPLRVAGMMARSALGHARSKRRT